MNYRFFFIVFIVFCFMNCTEDDPPCCQQEMEDLPIEGGVEYELQQEWEARGYFFPYVDSTGFFVDPFSYGLVKYVKSGTDWQEEELFSEIGTYTSVYDSPNEVLISAYNSAWLNPGETYWSDLTSLREINFDDSSLDSVFNRSFYKIPDGFLVSSNEVRPSSRVNYSWLSNGSIQPIDLGVVDRGYRTLDDVLAASFESGTTYAVLLSNYVRDSITLMKCEMNVGCTLSNIVTPDPEVRYEASSRQAYSFIQDGKIYFSMKRNVKFYDQAFVSVNIDGSPPVLSILGSGNTAMEQKHFLRSNPVGGYYSVSLGCADYNRSTYLFAENKFTEIQNKLHIAWQDQEAEYGAYQFFHQEGGRLYAYERDGIFIFDEQTNDLLESFRVNLPSPTHGASIRNIKYEDGRISLVASTATQGRNSFGYLSFRP